MVRATSTGTGTATRTGAITTADGLPLALLAWLSPSFPVGAFAFSHGLEWAVEAGDVRDAAGLRDWIGGLLHFGAIRADAVLLAAAYRDGEGADEVNALALALAPSAERRLETAAQGTAFLAAVKAAWPLPRPDRALERLAAREEVAYPVAVGAAARAHALPLRATLEAFALAAVSNLVSAALRLGPIGQSEAQAVIAALAPAVADLAGVAHASTLADLGTCAWRSDIAAMRHETQYSRLFRS